MALWENRDQLQERKVYAGGTEHRFKEGKAKVSEIFLWQDNPRLEDECSDFVDDDDGTIQYKLSKHLFADDQIRELMRTISGDGGINKPIYLYRSSQETNNLYVVLDGNCRFASVRELHKETPRDQRWKTIPAILLEGIDYDTAVSVSIRENVGGDRIEWKPYSTACSLNSTKQRKLDAGFTEEDAVKAAHETVKNAMSLEKVKRHLLAREFVAQYFPNDKSKFSAVLEGYIDPIRSHKHKAIINEGHYSKQDLDKMVNRCIRAEVHFESNPFRNKLKKVWPGALDGNALKRDFFDDLVNGKTSLDRASEVISQRIAGEAERKKMKEFLDFLDHNPQQRKHIVRAISQNEDIKNDVESIRDVLKVMINNAELNIEVGLED